MSTTMPKAAEVERKWYVLDAAGKPLGRVAAKAAELLRGKGKPIFSLGRHALTRLRTYAGSQHRHEAQNPQEYAL